MSEQNGRRLQRRRRRQLARADVIMRRVSPYLSVLVCVARCSSLPLSVSPYRTLAAAAAATAYIGRGDRSTTANVAYWQHARLVYCAADEHAPAGGHDGAAVTERSLPGPGHAWMGWTYVKGLCAVCTRHRCRLGSAAIERDRAGNDKYMTNLNRNRTLKTPIF